MKDQSYLDKKYFIDSTVYNCPFCNRRNVQYWIKATFAFNWTATKMCNGYLVDCSHCDNRSMHLSFGNIDTYTRGGDGEPRHYFNNIDIDSNIFYSVPTSFFVMDDRIPSVVRELITEAEGCLKMNYLTGSSACMRKAIYELTVIEKCKGADYEARIKYLKQKYTAVDPTLFDILSTIKDVTSDKVHEQSWDKWDSNHLKLIIETIKVILQEVYVVPKEKEERSAAVREMRSALEKDKQTKKKKKKTP